MDGEGGALSTGVCPRRAAGWATGRAILGKIQVNIGFRRQNLGSLYIRPRAVVTKYPKLKPEWLKTIDISCLPAMEASRSKSRCQQGWFPLRTVKENAFHAALPASGDSRRSLQTHRSNLFLLYMVFWYVSVSKFPCYEDISHIGLRLAVMISS